MTPNDLQYPVILFARDGFEIKRTAEQLTVTFQPLLTDGWFKNLKIVDSNGSKSMVVSVKGLGGVGLFWGYSLFFSRRVRIQLELEPIAASDTLSEVRHLVLKDFKDWQGWESRVDFDDLKAAVEKATSVAEILKLMAS